MDMLILKLFENRHSYSSIKRKGSFNWLLEEFLKSLVGKCILKSYEKWLDDSTRHFHSMESIDTVKDDEFVYLLDGLDESESSEEFAVSRMVFRKIIKELEPIIEQVPAYVLVIYTKTDISIKGYDVDPSQIVSGIEWVNIPIGLPEKD